MKLRALLNFLRSIGTSLLAVFGFLTAAIALLQLWRTENSLFWPVLLLFGVIVLWLSCFYIFFKKASPNKSVGFNAQSTEDAHIFGRKSRFIARIGIVATPLLFATGFFVVQYFRNLPSGKTVIMVANFNSLDGQNYGVTEKIIEQLRRETLHYADVEIHSLNASITVQDGPEKARRVAADHNATVFLWGWYRKANENVLISAHVEVLKKPAALTLMQDSLELIRPAQEIESFEIQARLSNELTYLTLLTVGLARMESEQYRDAISLFTRAIQLSAAPENLIDPGDIYLFRGSAYLDTQSYREAIEDFTKSLRLTPGSCGACALNQRAIAYANLGNLDAALSDFLESSKRDPTPPYIYMNLGRVYRERGEIERAIESFTEAIKRDEKLVSAYRQRGGLYLSRKQFEKAIENFNQVLHLEPHDAHVLNNRGIAFIKLGKYDQGIDDLNSSKLFSNKIVHTAHSHEGRYIDKALFIREMAKYSELLNSGSNSDVPYIRRGSLLYGVGDYERAIEDLDKALAINAQSADAFHERGKAKEALGLRDEAIGDFEKFLQFAKDETGQADAKEHLQRLRVPQ